MEGISACSSYRHSTKGMEQELAATTRITGPATKSFSAFSLGNHSFQNSQVSLRLHRSCFLDVNPSSKYYKPLCDKNKDITWIKLKDVNPVDE